MFTIFCKLIKQIKYDSEIITPPIVIIKIHMCLHEESVNDLEKKELEKNILISLLDTIHVRREVFFTSWQFEKILLKWITPYAFTYLE